MRLARVAHAGGVAFASVDGDELLEIADHPFGQPNYTGKRFSLADVRLLAPILPSKVIAIGRNYAEHAAEFGNEVPQSPMMFLKPSTSVIGPNAAIKLPAASQRVDFEGELAVVIGQPIRNVKAAQAPAAILGYTIANDVSARDLQKADGQWGRAKGFDTFCPLGPWIETAVDASDLAIRTEVDGELKQDSRTSLLIHKIPELVEFVSGVMTLLPGDVILTGTPAGVGQITDGQTVSITIEGIGTLTNPVQNA
ncbi:MULTISPECIES: fumarylacetoacetate hydrolase family protein [Amycolatopsis]|uniref:4-hydroxyphenylacetate degradation bifunctional isomerase/decarboxylase n=2 Tax=Amycolatopsis methanolica group TaxID=2893674 RepID=A0A076MLF5_AMYME|nr:MULTISPECIES: fumarylacetoacetate hydrolase family protein [Amycolatopsis methanolica group]AIJ21608.1 4-hydroxyphenylacetate degradation bifunctional isomerase/decarboxylase [Amycolatopsis methanolica 239]ROS39603.1 2-keto-4-pentenoate hydratase/2-oxohepta-3-ene-1,7-dioic acid hydratase in catechol pathway [Amycolatopsis thermoflava]